MIGSLVTMVMLSAEPSGSAAKALTKYEVKNLTLKVPQGWSQSVEEGTHKFVAPSGEAYFLVDVGTVHTKGMSGKTCVEKITTSLGGEWKRLKVGSAPAATRSMTDPLPEGKGEVETVSYVGCDGKTTWSLLFHMDKKKQAEFAPLATQVAKSVKYVRAGGK